MRLSPWKWCGLFAGIGAFVLLLAIDSPLQHHERFGARPASAAAVTALMAIWWLTEALPIYATACIPLALFPLLGVFPGDAVDNARSSVQPYFDPYISLFTGGMCIAAAMQQWNLHRRIALRIMGWIGTEPRRLLAGVLSASAFISLWISNTATAAMMLPIGLAVVRELELRLDGRRLVHFGAAVMLAVAYGANVGGIGTKIGTAPNALLAGFLAREGIEVSFLTFLAIGSGFVVLFLPIVWLALWRVGRVDAPRADVGAAVVRAESEKLGPMQRGEWFVACVFLGAASLWIMGKPLTELLKPRIHSFELRSAHVEGAIAMAAAVGMLALRVERRAVLELSSLRTLPWGALLLLGGSFSMAAGVQESGLSEWIGAQMHVLGELGPMARITIASAVTVALSAVASNTATIGVMLPVLWGGVPRAEAPSVAFAATIATSCDFAMPAGTPPNAIVFGSGYVTIPRMARTGVPLDLAAALLAAIWCWLVVDRLL